MAASGDIGYVHGYSRTEQDRLVDQARILAAATYARVEYDRDAKSLLEVGSGVGAQTLQLLARFPHLKITCVDREASQLARARDLLSSAVSGGQVTLVEGDAAALPFASASFDGAFVCWLLEHVEDPSAVLEGVRRVLAPGRRIWCTEVFNASVVVRPETPALVKWWAALSEMQRRLGGDPNLGMRLGALLDGAGFREVEVNPVVFLLDRRWSAAANGGVTRDQFLDYWRDLFLSAAPALESGGLTTAGDAAGLRAVFAALKADPDAIFYAQAMQASARA